MDSKQVFPSFGDFSNLVNNSFDKKDLDFQKKIVSEIGYESFEGYLKSLLDRMCNLFDLDALINEIGPDFQKDPKIVGFIPVLINKHINTSVIEEMQNLDEKIKKIPTNIQNHFRIFEEKSTKLFIPLMMEKHKNDPIRTEGATAFVNDFEMQRSTLNSDSVNVGQNIISQLNSATLPNINAVIKKYISPNFYFPAKAYLLKQLHAELVEKKFIEPNEDFEKSFITQILPRDIKPTLWLKDSTKLFYLLYRLNDKQEFLEKEGISIDKVANQLFSFKVKKTVNGIRTSFAKAYKQFENEDYLKKKMPEIIGLLKTLSI